MPAYPLTTAALMLALVVYVGAVMSVGRARGKYGVQAPATTGDPAFERVFRAQQNTVEQIILFLPLLALAALRFGDLTAGIYGLVWSAGRILYIITYARNAGSRAPGFLLSAGTSMLMLVALIVMPLVRSL
ncbi:MAPEG family protein [Sphingomonas sp.]|uniref:MAPEG family protein n=1 Tax=Sphingomonas sp. TaxID=28214 RepID=UPI00325FAA6C